MNSQVDRLKPHHEFMEKQMANDAREKSIVGSYHMEFTGTGWKDEFYKPGKMWLDIRQSLTTEGVYEASFHLGPALKGMMLISADRDALEIHSRIMDTVDVGAPDHEDEASTRDAFLQGFMYAMKRRRMSPEHEAKFAAHKEPHFQAFPSQPEKRYQVLVRGSHRVPEWEGDFTNKMTSETSALLVFKNGELCQFELSDLLWEKFKGVPVLPCWGEGSAIGYKVSDRPWYNAGEPDEEPRKNWYESMLDHLRETHRSLRDCIDDLYLDSATPNRNHKRPDWGSMREYSLTPAYAHYDRKYGWDRGRALEEDSDTAQPSASKRVKMNTT